MGYRGTTVQSSADDLSHVQFFSADSLKRLAAKNDFEIIEMGKTNFIEQVFPYSLITRRSVTLQRLDCALADRLPAAFASGFMTVWKKK